MKRKIFSIIIAAVLTVTSVFMTAPVSSASATASGSCGEGVSWILYDDGALSIYGDGSMDYIQRGEEFRGYASEIIKIDIGGDIDYVTPASFVGMFNIESITVDESNDEYCSEDGVLYSKSKDVIYLYPPSAAETEFTLPQEVRFVNEYAFYGNRNLICITLPYGVKEIGGNAFSYISGTAMRGIQIPSSVSKMAYDIFEMSHNITVYYTGTSGQWDDIKVVSHYSDEEAVELAESDVAVEFNGTMPVSELLSAASGKDVLFEMPWGMPVTREDLPTVIGICAGNAVLFLIIFLIGKKFITRKKK